MSTVKPGMLASIALGGGAAVITCNFTQCVPRLSVGFVFVPMVFKYA